MALNIKNTSGASGVWAGQALADLETYTINATERTEWLDDANVFSDIANGNLTVNDGQADIEDPRAAWQHIEGTQSFPLSELDDGAGTRKLAVHPSYKPSIENGDTYAVWTGAGDDVNSTPSVLGGGDLLHFDTVTGTPTVTKDVKFDHSAFGRVWIHEAYLRFENGGEGDYIISDIMSAATTVQQSVNLDLILDGDKIKYSPSGPGTGTHGFAATPSLIPRKFSKDGDWDYDGTNLTPNMSGTGLYNICTVDTAVHRYVNKIPCQGSCPTYFSMSSDETAEILPGYFIRVKCHNVSDSTWHASVIMEIYREVTTS